MGRCGREQRGTGTWLLGRGDSLRADNNPTQGSEAAAYALSQSHYEAMRRTTLGKPDAVKPPVRFDEGRGWGPETDNCGLFNSVTPASPTLLRGWDARGHTVDEEEA